MCVLIIGTASRIVNEQVSTLIQLHFRRNNSTTSEHQGDVTQSIYALYMLIPKPSRSDLK